MVFNERSHYNCEECQNLGQYYDEVAFSSPVLYSKNDLLDKNIKWSHKLQQLSEYDRSFRTDVKYDNPTQNNIFKGYWNTANDTFVEGYLPIRSKTSNPAKYGWIKLRITNHSQVEVLEIALQQ